MIKISFCDSVVIMRHWEVTIGSSLKVGKVGNVNFFPFEVQCFVNQINKDWRSKKSRCLTEMRFRRADRVKIVKSDSESHFC